MEGTGVRLNFQRVAHSSQFPWLNWSTSIITHVPLHLGIFLECTQGKIAIVSCEKHHLQVNFKCQTKEQILTN